MDPCMRRSSCSWVEKVERPRRPHQVFFSLQRHHSNENNGRFFMTIGNFRDHSHFYDASLREHYSHSHEVSLASLMIFLCLPVVHAVHVTGSAEYADTSGDTGTTRQEGRCTQTRKRLDVVYVLAMHDEHLHSRFKLACLALSCSLTAGTF